MKNLRQELRDAGRSIEAFVKKHPLALSVGMVALAALLLLLRRPETIFGAQFWAEDGPHWYGDAYSDGIVTLLEPYGSYFVLTYRFIGLLSQLLPFHLAPAFFGLCALGIQLLPVILLCSGRLKNIIPYRSLAFAIALAYIAIPNTAEIFTNLTNIQWHLGIATFLILLAAPRKQWWWQAFDIGVLLMNGLSGPLIIVMWPLAAYMWWRNKKSAHHIRNLAIFTVLAIVQAISIFFIAGDSRIGAQPNADIMALITMITGQVFTGGLLGEANVALTYGNTILILAVFTVCMSIIVYAVVKGPLWLRLANVFSLFVITSSLLALRRATDFNTWVDMAQPGHNQRYWYIPIVMWLATLLWVAIAAKNRLCKAVAILCIALFLLVGIPTDWRVRQLPYLDFRARAVQFEQASPGTTVTIPLNPVGGWEMTLTKK